METKLYVGNLSYNTSEDDLRALFAEAGTVTSVALIKDRESGRSKGFAFVEMSTQSELEEAIKILNGKMVDNREIKVNIARPPEDRRSSGYRDRSDKGGFRDRNKRNRGSGPRRY